MYRTDRLGNKDDEDWNEDEENEEYEKERAREELLIAINKEKRAREHSVNKDNSIIAYLDMYGLIGEMREDIAIKQSEHIVGWKLHLGPVAGMVKSAAFVLPFDSSKKVALKVLDCVEDEIKQLVLKYGCDVLKGE
jgi:hypothetical protein